ncbi:T9SS type B sorting domain-containing protein, partial [Flagellimonas hymeniacidonis]
SDGNYFDAPNGGGNALSAGDIIPASTTLHVFSPANGTCPAVDNTFDINIDAPVVADAPNDVNNCGAYQLPPLVDGNYFDAPNGGGNALSAGDIIPASTTLHVFSPANGTCPAVDNSFELTIHQLTIVTSIQNDSCLETNDGSISISIENGIGPYQVGLNSNPVINFVDDNFIIDGLAAGNYSLTIADSNGCSVNQVFEIQTEGINLGAIVNPTYDCDSGVSTNMLDVTLLDPTVAQDVLYALDSTNPNDFVLSPNFTDINPGNHFLSILHVNGCMETIPFEIDTIAPLTLGLANTNINEITATVTGGTGPYTYFFNDRPATNNNIFSITESGSHFVRVVDSNGCESFETISLNLLELETPNFFTPNNDGQNDSWKPKNTEAFSNMETIIYDRYGREIKIMGPFDDGWDGHYEGKALPSGDYWYIIQLNDGTERAYVGHFTLYR